MSGDSMLKIIDMDTGEGLNKREDLVNFITADPEMSMQKFAHGLLMVLTDEQMLKFVKMFYSQRLKVNVVGEPGGLVYD